MATAAAAEGVAVVKTVSGEEPIYLGRGVYLTVSHYGGNVLIHLRKYTIHGSDKVCFKDELPPGSVTTVAPMKKGIALNYSGWRYLMGLNEEVICEYNRVARANGHAEAGEMSAEPQTGTWSPVEAVTGTRSGSSRAGWL